MSKRSGLIIALLSVGAILAIVVWMFALSERLVVLQHDLRTSSVKPPLRVVQLSDLHLHSMGRQQRAVVQKVKALRPDLLVLSGDMVDRADALPVLAAFLDSIGPVRTVAVPGNWEHWSEVDFVALRQLFELRPDGQFLLNQRWSFAHGARTVEVIGLDDFTAGQPDLRLLTPGAEADLSVLVQHSPGFFEKAEIGQHMGVGRIELCLSGHTHGGQIAFWGWAPFRPRGSGQFVTGFYDVPGCRLYVSKGVGTSVLPLRWGASPEVVVFDL